MIETLLQSRGMFYIVGAIVVTMVVFATSAKHPEKTCRRCRVVNRPMARFCAHCGHELNKP